MLFSSLAMLCAQEGQMRLLASAFPGAWHVCFPGRGEGSGVHQRPSARAAHRAGHQPRLQVPISSCRQPPGLGEAQGPGWTTSQLCLQPLGGLRFCLSQGPTPAAGQRAPEAHACAWPAPAPGKGFLTGRPCASCTCGCLPVPPGPWTPSPASFCMSLRQVWKQTPWKSPILS